MKPFSYLPASRRCGFTATRALPLTASAQDDRPKITVAVKGIVSREITLATLMNPFPLDWSDQRRAYFSVERLLHLGD